MNSDRGRTAATAMIHRVRPRRVRLPQSDRNARRPGADEASGRRHRSTPEPSAGDITISPGRVTRALAGIAAVLVTLGILSSVVTHALGRPTVFGLVPLFDLDLENTVPAFFSALLLVAIAVCLFLVGRTTARDDSRARRTWYAMAGVAGFMAVDEAASIHELLIRPTGAVLGNEGVLHFAWIIPGAVVVLLVTLLFGRFVARLPRATRRILIASALIYGTAVLGIEALGGAWASANGMDNPTYDAIVTLEESLELAALLLALYGLLAYLEARRGRLVLALR